MSYISALVAAIKANPIRAVGVVRSIIALAVAFGVGLSSDQTAAIVALTVVLLGVDEAVRSQVTPVSDPVLSAGDQVTTPEGVRAVVQFDALSKGAAIVPDPAVGGDQK